MAGYGHPYLMLAPPPTRRCAVLASAVPGPVVGSSAHAEMRHRRASEGGGPLGLLRPRGDAPPYSTPLGTDPRAPPPTRRCAHTPAALSSRLPGSSAHAEMRQSPARATRRGCRLSAHAEMRPGGSASTTPESGLLRPRGDAPVSRGTRSRHRAAPPPTRRCALDEMSEAQAQRGSSPTGDAPRRSARLRERRWAPPPTRRCARCRIRQHERVPGSSAHAEMRPAVVRSACPPSWLLRPRGDAPRGHAEGVPATGSPPTRRCAVPAFRAATANAGSSAHAEMRPERRGLGCAGLGLLPPRGDAPHAPDDAGRKRRAPPPTRRCALL